LRAARLHALKEDIAINLAQQGLSVKTLTERHGISPRYVNMLFETEGVPVTEFVLRQRLALAHRQLSDPLLGARSISDIAYDVGFHGLSYFNRAFRRHYGATPSEIRAAAMNG
jgi:AraC-like DNA-binding protein